MPPALTPEGLHRRANSINAASASGGAREKQIASDQSDRNSIEEFFGLSQEQATENGNPPVELAFKRVDEWCLYEPAKRPWGLPAVLRSRLSQEAPEVFLFLLRLARVSLETGRSPDDATCKKLLGLATALHWFINDRPKAVRWLWETEEPEQWLNGAAFGRIKPLTKLHEDLNDPTKAVQSVPLIRTPEELEGFIDRDSLEKGEIKDWAWWGTLVGKAATRTMASSSRREKEQAINRRWLDYQTFIDILAHRGYKRTNALLLMYSQRKQMAAKFSAYDPSRVGYWDSHNVPWDFDHILPKSAFFHRHKGHRTYVEVCKQWGNTIANLHVYPFEDNRSRHDESACGSLPAAEDELRRMLLWDGDESEKDRRRFFSLTGLQVEDSWQPESESLDMVYDFVLDARARIIRIYRDWFDTLLIKDLL